MLRLVSEPPAAGRLAGTIAVPASKYHAHRALILGSLAEGCSVIEGRTGALHVRATLGALKRLGTRLQKEPWGYRVWGGPYRPVDPQITVGSSGSTLQFLLGLGCRAVGPAVVFDGQKYFRRRPIGPLLGGLRAMGLRLESTGDGLPVTVQPGRPHGGRVEMSGQLSQWISGLLLLAPFASRDTEIVVRGELNERPYVELTIAMMAAWGVEVEASPDLRRLVVPAGQRYRPTTYRLPADISSASFPLVAASLLPSDVTFTGIDPHPDHPEARMLDILREAGVPMQVDPERRTVRVTTSERPRGVHVDCRDTPDLLPVMAVFGAFARGRTVLDNVENNRLKESDRVVSMLQLRRMGVRIDEEGQGRLVIHGADHLQPAALSSFNDHRVLMSLAIAGALTQGGRTEISYPQAYRISYPEFLEHMQSLGLPLRVQRTEAEADLGPWARTPTRGSVPELRSMMPAEWERQQRAGGHWPERLIVDYLDDAAAWTPDQAAVVDGSRGAPRVLSFRDLQGAVDRVATALVRRGVRPGEPVAFQLPNWWEFVVLQLALVRIGAVSCPLMPIYRERELAFMLRQSACRVLVLPGTFRNHDYLAMAASLRGELPDLEHLVVVGEAQGEAESFSALLAQEADQGLLASRRPSPDAVVQLLYTSGTSGQPKGVLHTHNTLLAGLEAHRRHFRLTDRDTGFIPSPLGHQTGFLYGMWLAVALGATQVLQDVWDAERAWELMSEWQVAFVQAATPFLTDLVEESERRGRGPGGLRIFVATGAPVPRVLARAARDVLRAEIIGGWGSTESGLVAAGSPGGPPDRLWQTDGRVIAPMAMRVVDEHGREVPPGTQGRFQVWTPGMFVGYLGHEDWYLNAFPEPGWFDTGDLAVIDRDGYMRISGRTKDVINRGGEKVPVAEVEECLYAHPSVAEVAVVGMPDPRLGERACACVVLRPGATLNMAQMQAHLAQARMAKQYWPERLEVLPRMPRTPSGKIQKFVLRAWVAERLTETATAAPHGSGGRDA